jgi:glycosyltransferase involved in cell wall biosynthesis
LSSQTELSIIIPTKNRPDDLAATIGSILKQSQRPTQLVIVDQSDQKTFQAGVPFRLEYIYDPSIGGLTAARNRGMAAATGDIWLFLDDDVILEPNFIFELTAAYSSGADGVSGIITNYTKPPLGRLMWDTVFMRGRFQDDRQAVYVNVAQHIGSPPIRVRQLGGGLMSFRANCIRNLQFDENNRGAGPGEDIDFCAQLPRDAVLLINPRARLVHKKSPEARTPAHWLTLHAQVYYYMRERHWRRGIQNNLCFAWLNLGYALAALLSCAKRRSLAPWRAWREGAMQGLRLAHPGRASNS